MAEKGYFPALVMSFRSLTRETMSGDLPFAKETIDMARKTEHKYTKAQWNLLGSMLAEINTFLWFGKNFDTERGELPELKKFGKELLDKNK